MTSCPEPVLANGDRFHEAHIYLTDGKETHTGVFKRKVSCWQVCPRDLEHVRKPARVHPGVNNCPCAKKNRPLSLCQPLPVDVWTRASLPWQMIDSKHSLETRREVQKTRSSASLISPAVGDFQPCIRSYTAEERLKVTPSGRPSQPVLDIAESCPAPPPAQYSPHL